MSQRLNVPEHCCLPGSLFFFFLLVLPAPLNRGSVNRETGEVASNPTASAQMGSTPVCKGRELPWSLQELPEKSSIFHMGSSSGLSSAVAEIPALLPGAELCSRLWSVLQPIFPLKYIPGWLLTVHYFILSNPFLFVYLWQIFADLLAHILGKDYAKITVALSASHTVFVSEIY